MPDFAFRIILRIFRMRPIPVPAARPGPHHGQTRNYIRIGVPRQAKRGKANHRDAETQRRIPGAFRAPEVLLLCVSVSLW